MALCKIRIITCAYKRPEILEVFLKSFLKNKEALKDKIILSLSITGSSKEDDNDCKDIFDKLTPKEHWSESDNFPLSNKWNKAIKEALKKDWDYCMISGSDDIYNEKLFLTYLQYIERGYEYIGVKDFFLFDSQTSQLKYWKGYENKRTGESTGAGRLISRKIIEESIPLYKEGINNGLDGSMTSKIKTKGLVLSCLENKMIVLDVKSKTNIWNFEKYPGENIKPEYLQKMNVNVYEELLQLSK